MRITWVSRVQHPFASLAVLYKPSHPFVQGRVLPSLPAATTPDKFPESRPPAARMSSMQAETINCPMCGAATSTDAPRCQYCGSQLATIACPSCFAMMYLGSRHCPRCGAAAARRDEVEIAGRRCPRCKSEMQLVSIGDSRVLGGAGGLGLWLRTDSFQKICDNREQQAAVLRMA